MSLLEEYGAALGDLDTAGVEVTNATDVLPSRLATTQLAVGSVVAAAGAALRLLRARGGDRGALVDGRRVSAAFRSDKLFRLDGESARIFAPLSGFWPTGDGWLRTHANYPHHRERLLRALGLPGQTTPEGLCAALAGWRAVDAEDAVVAAGGVCSAVRSAAEWREHPQATAVAGLPLVAFDRVGAARPRSLPPLPGSATLPAAGLRVLDLTRVIAGPVASRTLALLGADVLRVDPPQLPELTWQHLDTGMGKRSAILDPAERPDLLDRLLGGAHVVLTGYRPHSLDRFGLAPEALASRYPGLVLGRLSAWGDVGPWGGRRGFDSIVQAATGIAVAEATEPGVPGALPAQALDHATGYLLAAAVLDAVTRQLAEGGTLHVRVHLARTAAWLLDHADDRQRRLPDVDDLVLERETPSGRLRYAPPALQLQGGPADWTVVGSPWGVNEPRWTSE